MRSRRFRRTVGFAAALGVLAAAAGLGVALTRGSGGERDSLAAYLREHRNQPTAVGLLLRGGERGHESEAAGPAQEDYENRAFPAASIAFAQQQTALKDAKKVLKHAGVRFPKPWDSIGPDTLNVDTLGTQTFGPPTQWSGRVTALALDPKCSEHSCKLYLGAAGGGVWMTPNALSPHPDWKFISNELDSTSIGTIVVDPTDPSGRTIYVGTGEPSGSGDSEAGVGLYRSTDGGQHFTLLDGSVPVAKDRGIGALAVDPSNPQHLLLGTTVARHGLSSDSGGRFTPAGAPPIGLYESKDGGATWKLAFSQPQDPVAPGSATGNDFFRGGVTDIEYDPSNPSAFYFAMFGYGLFRSSDNGGSYESIFADTVSADDPFSIRYEFATAKLPSGKTRIYLGAGYNEEADAKGNLVGASRLFRVDDASASAASLTTGGTNGGWTDLSSDKPADPGFASFDFCEAQCSYDIVVASPPGRPDTVVIGGAMQYGELPLYGGPDRSNGRAVQLSTDAGVSFTDLTGDATPQASGLLFSFEDMHPDQHAVVFDPANPDVMFAGSDGGVIRTSGQYADNSAACDDRGLSAGDLAICHAWLSRIPTKLTTLNSGLDTLQFQSLSVNPNDPLHDALGGTQDNGTLAFSGSGTWFLGVTGDGGDSGIDAVDGKIRFHTYTNTFVDVNFNGDTPETWDWIGDPMLFSGEQSGFYAPMRQDPVIGGQIFAGMERVWRTQDSGGSRAFLDAHCNTTGVFGTSDQLFTGNCGDWVPISPNLANDPSFGSKAGSYVVAIERGHDAHTLWAGTRRGRIFVSQNADAPAASVAWTRIDTDAQPKRFPSGISVDPTNPLHAIVTYSGYDAYAAAAGTAPGHVFDVLYDPAAKTAKWTNIDYDLGDQPILDVVYDQPTGDVYVSTDFGVNRLPAGQTSWIPAADGLPTVAVYGLTLAGGRKSGDRVLYAATHGRGAWRLSLPDVKHGHGGDKGKG